MNRSAGQTAAFKWYITSKKDQKVSADFVSHSLYNVVCIRRFIPNEEPALKLITLLYMYVYECAKLIVLILACGTQEITMPYIKVISGYCY